MERRSTPRADWTVGRDDQGRAVLVWRLPAREIVADATTDDVLDALSVPGLALLEDDSLLRRDRGFDPYDLRSPAVRRRK